jgi:hypothetical protein
MRIAARQEELPRTQAQAQAQAQAQRAQSHVDGNNFEAVGKEERWRVLSLA